MVPLDLQFATTPIFLCIPISLPSTFLIYPSVSCYLYLIFQDLTLFAEPWNLSASEHDALLLPKAKFPVGYGDSGSQPWGFTLDKAVKSDVTFFKLFVTSRHTDFSAARQESPFVSSKRDGQVANMHNTLPDVWGTVIVTAAQEHSLPIQEQIRR